MKERIRYWSPVAVMMLAAAILMTVWAFQVPIFESPDEPIHWANSQYMYSHHALPPYDETYLEGNQAPLYYMLIAPFASSSASPESLVAHSKAGSTLTCPPRLFASCPGDWHRFLEVRRGRMASILIGLMGVFFTGLAAWELSGSIWTACLAIALIGFLPQFDFRAASINNDVAAAAFSAMAVYFVARMIQRGYAVRTAVFAGIGVGLAILSKINAGVTLPFFAAAILLTGGSLMVRIRRLWLVLIPIAMVSPWAIRNKIYLGDFLGLAAMPGVVPTLYVRRALSDPYFLTLPAITWKTFIGYFGWLTILAPHIVYTVYAIVFIAGLVGFFWWTARHAELRMFALLLLTVPVMSMALYVYFNSTIPQPQGRLLFPGLSACVVILALGLSSIRRVHSYLAVLVVLVCASLNAYTLKKAIIPAYWSHLQPTILTETVVPDTLTKGGPLGPIEPGHRFTQSFTATRDNLSGVDLEIAGYAEHMKHGFVQLTLAEHEGGNLLAATRIPATKVPGCCIFAHLEFTPITNSAGKQYFASLATGEMALPDAVTVFLSAGDVYKDGEAFFDGKRLGKDTSFRTFYSTGLYCGMCLAERE